MRYKLLILIFIGMFHTSFGQDFAKDFRKIIESFQKLTSYSIETTVNLIGEDSSSIFAFVKCSKYGKHFKVGDSELLINNNYFISIDHNYKEIRVEKGKDFNYEVKMNKDDIGMDELERIIRDSSHIQYLGKTKYSKTYEIYVDNAIDKLIVKIDLLTGFFNEIEYVYRTKTDGLTGYKVKYSTFLPNCSLPKSSFSEANVFKIIKNKVVLTQKYKAYQISFID